MMDLICQEKEEPTYKVTKEGGPRRALPFFENRICWPKFNFERDTTEKEGLLTYIYNIIAIR